MNRFIGLCVLLLGMVASGKAQPMALAQQPGKVPFLVTGAARYVNVAHDVKNNEMLLVVGEDLELNGRPLNAKVRLFGPGKRTVGLRNGAAFLISSKEAARFLATAFPKAETEQPYFFQFFGDTNEVFEFEMNTGGVLFVVHLHVDAAQRFSHKASDQDGSVSLEAQNAVAFTLTAQDLSDAQKNVLQ